MKTRKLIAFWLVSLLSFVWFWYWVDYTNWFVEYNWQFLNPSSNSWNFCIYIWWDFQSWNLPQWSLNLWFNCTSQGCNSWGQYTYYTFKTCLVLDWYEVVNISAWSLPSEWTVYYSFTPFSSDCEVCEECPTCPVYNLSLAPLGWSTENYAITWNVNVVVNDWIDYELDSHNNALWLSVWLNTEIWWQCSWSVIDSWTNWSALYINDIQHESAPLINLTIPEEFERDYTNDSEEFNLWVSWYNVDTAYIDWIITTQKTLPDKQDFNNTISWLLPLFIPWLVIIACLYFIFRFIKKVF